MPLRFISDPAGGPELVLEHFQKIARRPKPPTALTRSVGAFSAVNPHSVYDLRADDIFNGGGLESARRTGVRYDLVANHTVVAAAEISIDNEEIASEIRNINFGKFPSNFAHSLQSASQLKETFSEIYEVRLLRFTAIYLMSIWLVSDFDSSGFIVTVPPVPRGLRSTQLYRPKKFLKEIAPLVKAIVLKVDKDLVP
jgi:hypothetical protein